MNVIKTELAKALSFNLQRAIPRNTHKEVIISYIQQKTGMNELAISNKLNSLFKIKDNSARLTMFFSAFLFMPDKTLKKLLDFNYSNSVPYEDELYRIKQRVEEIFAQNDVLKKLNSGVADRTLDLMFSTSFKLTPETSMMISSVDYYKVLTILLEDTELSFRASQILT